MTVPQRLCFSAHLSKCHLGTCWHIELSMLGLLHLRNARLHYLVSIEFVNGMCLSNSDFEVQSAGYNSAQSPTNWQSIHGKDPSILCRQGPPRLSIGLDDKNPKCGIQDCGLRLETCTNVVDTIFFQNSKNLL